MSELADPSVLDVEPPRSVPFVDIAADYRVHRYAIDQAVGAVLERGDFILGAATDDFEREFAAYCGTAHAVGVDSGFSALELILRAFDIGPGDEVITTANTFYSTVRAIEATGATPVLIDADPALRVMDPRLIEAALTTRTRALLPVHLYGHPVDMDAVNEIAHAHGLFVFEDACQAHGAWHRGRRAGSLGDAAAFSFYPSKNLGAAGDAGIVVTDRPDIAERVRRSRSLGSAVKGEHHAGGFNRRLDTLQAAVLRVKLPHLDVANEKRRVLASQYRAVLGDLGLGLPRTADWGDHVYHLFVIETPDRDRLAHELADRGIATGVHYPVPIHLQPAFASLGHGLGDFPVAEHLSRRILSLPMHPHMTHDDVEFVGDAVRASLLAPTRPTAT